MTQKLIHRLIGAAVFLVAAVQFFTTAQPTVSFWDPGELSAAAYLLQVPHPPGGPLFSLVGRLLYLLPIPGNLGFRMNMLSILASAGVVLFLYLIAVRLIENFRGRTYNGIGDMLGTYLPAAIGALALSFIDTFWFNAVEANYFAASTFLYSVMMWLALVWYEKADEPGSSRYLLGVAYLVGLSAGVHLMSIPSFFVVMMIVIFRRVIVNDAVCKKTGYILLGHAAVLLLVTFAMWNNLVTTQPPTSEEFHAYDQKFLLIMAGISAVIMFVFRKSVFQRDSIYVPILVAGVALGAAYPGIIKKLPQIIHVISKDDSTLGLIILFAVCAAIGYLAYWSKQRQKNLLHIGSLAVLLIILGFSTYTMIMIRANAHPPMNENDPKNFSGLLSYINREQYGDFPIFKRRWTPEQDRQKTWTNYATDLDFFTRYQMHHMFQRYVLFNYVGSVSRDQDADWSAKQTWAIPFLVGLFGLYYQFKKDWRMATSFVILFILMGYLITFYQNQQEPQPRERDYFYGGAYFVFALWIAIGVRGLVDLLSGLLKEPRVRTAGTAGVLVLAAVLIPGRLFQVNYHSHDRSNNWVPRDYAYNLLQTCDKDAILFTNGDNDTFPLWYLQDVEGVRRDVRVVNLSLVNTSWYIEQLKHREPHGAPKVPITITDPEIANIQPIIWEPRTVDIDVPGDAYETLAIKDTSITNRGKISWMMNNTLQFGKTKAIRVQDIMVLNIVQATKWRRPIYFAVTCSPDSRIGLDEYLRFCGLAWKLVPTKATEADLGIDIAALEGNLMNQPDEVFTTPNRGYRFQCMADTTVFYDENEIRMLSGFRSTFRALAIYNLDVRKDMQKAGAVLAKMEQSVPWAGVPASIEEEVDFAFLYRRAGFNDKFEATAARAEAKFRTQMESGSVSNPYLYGAMIQIYELKKDYAKELDLLNTLARMYPNDPGLKSRIETVQALVNQSKPGPLK